MEAGHSLKTQTSANPTCKAKISRTNLNHVIPIPKLTKTKMKAKAIINNPKDKTAYAETIIF